MIECTLRPGVEFSQDWFIVMRITSGILPMKQQISETPNEQNR
ncbi:hypothetical protein HMPREF0880_03733 [Yokenella regensburgei ATCC 43003]|nr:hypothetical protein HMPREF0880_03733 [Yokenella regensburgei ATCC 43003]